MIEMMKMVKAGALLRMMPACQSEKATKGTDTNTNCLTKIKLLNAIVKELYTPLPPTTSGYHIANVSQPFNYRLRH